MTAFADSSAIVKIYADEPGSEHVRSHDHLVVSVLSRVEVAAAIWRKHRTGELPAASARLLVDAFLSDWAVPAAGSPTFLPVAVVPVVLDSAVLLAGVHGLRAYDAVQLASALAARSVTPAVTAFLGFDEALSRAAAAEGFTVSAPL